MAKAVVFGCACVIISELTPEDVKRYQLYQPDMLTLADESYKVDLDDDGPGCICDDRASLSKTTSADGKATITVLLDPENDDKTELVRAKIGPCLVKLDRLENQLLAGLEEITKEEDRANAMITVM